MQFSDFLECVFHRSYVKLETRACCNSRPNARCSFALFASRCIVRKKIMESIISLAYNVYKRYDVYEPKTFEHHSGKEFLLYATLMNATNASINIINHSIIQRDYYFYQIG